MGDKANCQSQPFSRAHSIVEVSECGCVGGDSHQGGLARPFLPQLVPEFDETEIVGDCGRSPEIIPAQHQPPWLHSLRCVDTHTAWDHPKPIRWRHTVPCGALNGEDFPLVAWRYFSVYYRLGDT